MIDAIKDIHKNLFGKKSYSLIFLIGFILCFNSLVFAHSEVISLNGEREIGESRHYERTIKVPGIATDPVGLIKSIRPCL